MKAWTDIDSKLISQYIGELNLRPRSIKTYRPFLIEFQQFVRTHSSAGSVSRHILEQWFRSRMEFSSLDTILQRFDVIDRFLDWLARRNIIAANPIRELIVEFGARYKIDVARALSCQNSQEALEVLRPIPRFASILGPVMRDHVARMRALGCRYVSQELELLRFDRFLQTHPELQGLKVSDLAEAWGNDDPSPRRWLECAQVERMILCSLQRMNPEITLPAVDSRLEQQVRKKLRKPYIYSDAEISCLFAATQLFKSHRVPNRPLMLYTVLVLAYCVGLRIGEVVRLRLVDIDLKEGTIEIRGSKFFKSRRLPVDSSVVDALRSYLKTREEDGAPNHPEDSLFWCSSARCGYGYVTIRSLLLNVLRRAGLKPRCGRIGPRIHDLRHTFVVHRLLKWYRDGVDAQARLQYLATYLGHEDISSTLVYITVTEELMQCASERFRSYVARSFVAARAEALC
jgi:integrase/recombinase XerD